MFQAQGVFFCNRMRVEKLHAPDGLSQHQARQIKFKDLEPKGNLEVILGQDISTSAMLTFGVG